MRTAVIILGHGSRSSDADRAIRKVADELRSSGQYAVVEHAFLQYVPPAPGDVLRHCIGQKADRVVIVPFFLQAGAHVTRDIPELLERSREQYPAVEIMVTDYVGTHPLMAQIVQELVKNAQDPEA